MINEATLTAEIARASRANILVNDELLNESFQHLEKLYYAEWLRTAPEQREHREHLYVAIRVLTQVQGHLRKVITDGSKAAEDLKWLREAYTVA